MEPARSINELGFRRWYERQLLEAFAWLASCLLCAFVALASVEALSVRASGVRAAILLALAYVAGMVCWNALRRFVRQLALAEHYASRSTCAQCSTQGRFTVIGQSGVLRVRCRKCANEWTIVRSRGDAPPGSASGDA